MSFPVVDVDAIPLVMTAAGPVPTPPATLRVALVDAATALSPGITTDLPASLVEDVTSTQVAGLAEMDTARVEAINSISPFGANPFILAEQGQMLGIPIGQQTNTSVFIVFTGPPGFTIGKGFRVTDGTFQYTVADGGIIQEDGDTISLFCVATIQGSWAVPPGTVTTIQTSLPDGVVVTCTNPAAGVPGLDTGESQGSYRARTQQAMLSASQGMSRYLKTLLGKVSGVQPRLVSVRQVIGQGWEVLVGGGDPYQVANAIFQSLFDINDLVGSVTGIVSITKANPGVVTTDINHGLTDGETDVVIADCAGMTAANGGPYTVHVLTEKTFSFGVDTTGFGTYTGNGVVTPNTRNVIVSINDTPDTYVLNYVNPPPQTVTIEVTWNTNSPNFVSEAAVAQLGAPALAAYVNSIFVGQPMNLFVLQSVFQEAVQSILDPSLLTRMVFQVNINGISTAPDAGTGIIDGDPESYFTADASGITIVQG